MFSALIGAKRVGADLNDFAWLDGSPWAFHPWASGEPNNAFGREHCLVIYTDEIISQDNPPPRPYLHMWNDVDCDAHYRVAVCKKAALVVCWHCNWMSPTKYAIPIDEDDLERLKERWVVVKESTVMSIMPCAGYEKAEAFRLELEALKREFDDIRTGTKRQVTLVPNTYVFCERNKLHDVLP
ncbi:unnamed protein product, partial [Mesorhabditis spiculigera]